MRLLHPAGARGRPAGPPRAGSRAPEPRAGADSGAGPDTRGGRSSVVGGRERRGVRGGGGGPEGAGGGGAGVGACSGRSTLCRRSGGLRTGITRGLPGEGAGGDEKGLGKGCWCGFGVEIKRSEIV